MSHITLILIIALSTSWQFGMVQIDLGTIQVTNQRTMLIAQEVSRSGNRFQWPSVDVVVDYRRRVRRLVCDVINRCDIQLPVTVDSLLVS